MRTVVPVCDCGVEVRVGQPLRLALPLAVPPPARDLALQHERLHVHLLQRVAVLVHLVRLLPALRARLALPDVALGLRGNLGLRLLPLLLKVLALLLPLLLRRLVLLVRRLAVGGDRQLVVVCVAGAVAVVPVIARGVAPGLVQPVDLRTLLAVRGQAEVVLAPRVARLA